MKNKLDGTNGRFNIAEEKIREYEDAARTHKTRNKKKKQRISVCGKNSLNVRKYTHGIYPWGRERKIFGEITAEKLPNLMKIINP